MLDPDYFEKAFANPKALLDRLEKTSDFESSPLVGAKEILPANTVLFVKATKADFRTIHLKRSGYTRLVFDCRILAGKLEP